MRTSKETQPGAQTREKILDTANKLFAERGVEGVSLRELTLTAGVNIAAVHYHFGSKEGILQELFDRSSKPIVKWRLDLLDKVRRHPNGRPYLEDVLEAFLRPALILGRRQNAAFVHLRARLALERDDAKRAVLSRTFDASSRKFIAAIAEALPDLPEIELYWRFHFLMGSMFYTMADSGRIQSLTGGRCDPGDSEAALRHIVEVFTRVFAEPCAQKPKRKTGTGSASSKLTPAR